MTFLIIYLALYFFFAVHWQERFWDWWNDDDDDNRT